MSKKIQTNQILLVAAGLALGFLILGGVSFLRNHKVQKKIEIKQRHVVVNPAISKEDEQAAALARLGSGIVKAKESQSASAQEQNKTDEAQNKRASIIDAHVTAMEKQIEMLEQKLSQNQNAQVLAAKQAQIDTGGIQVDEAPKTLDAPQTGSILNLHKKHTIDNYVPSGTIARAVVLGGADVGAGVSSQSSQSTMVLRLVSNGTMPNDVQSHLKDCVLTMAATGDISSERGIIKSETLSCTWPDGHISEKKVEASVFGVDGKEGLRGEAVFREADQLQRAFLAGTIGGLAKGVGDAMTTPIQLADGIRKTVMPKDVFEHAGAQGLQDAMSQLAAYHIKRAELYHPIIQLKAGGTVDVLFKKGFDFDPDLEADDE